jgi:hypothetical protein
MLLLSELKFGGFDFFLGFKGGFKDSTVITLAWDIGRFFELCGHGLGQIPVEVNRGLGLQSDNCSDDLQEEQSTKLNPAVIR